MLTLKKVAITGGVACGKTAACHFFEKYGAYIVSADDIVHNLLNSHKNIQRQVIDIVGEDVIVEGGLCRERIAEKVFDDKSLLVQLEEILHPAVYSEIDALYSRVYNEKKYKAFVVEVPLLFETGRERSFDITITVIADVETCRERERKGSCHRKDDFDARMLRQLPMVEKALKADIVIVNDGAIEDLEKKVKDIIHGII